MNRKVLYSLVILACIGLCGLAETRTWTARSGATVEATLIERRGDRIVLEKSDGKRLMIRLEKLSPEDVAYVRDLGAAPEKAVREAELPWPAGKVSGPIQTDTDPAWNYHLYIPNGLPAGEKWPVMFVMSPGGGNAGTLNRYIEGAELNKFILAVSVESKNRFNKSGTAVLAMVMDVSEKLDVDPDQLYASGFSGGARMSFWLAEQYKSKGFAGVLACGAGSSGRKFSSKTNIYGLCGSNCFNRWDMASSIKSNKEDRMHLRFFPGNHDWASKELITEAMTWLNGCTLKKPSRDTRLSMRRDAYSRRVMDWVEQSAVTHPERAYTWARFISRFPAQVETIQRANKVVRDLESSPGVQTCLAAETDVEKFWKRHFATSAGDYLRNNGTKQAQKDGEKYAAEYTGSSYEQLFKRMGQKSVMP